MLNITYAPSQTETAQQLQKKLAGARRLQALSRNTLVILVTSDALEDADILNTTQKAQRSGTVTVPLLLENVPLPPELQANALDVSDQDLTKHDTLSQIVSHILRSAVGQRTRTRNRVFLAILGIAVLAVFFWAISGITAGTVGFPVDEYNTEEAANLEAISTFVFPTLNGLQPRSTEDALNFSETVEAASTRDRVFLIETATQLPLNQQATAAINNAAATGTVAAMTATPPAANTTESNDS